MADHIISREISIDAGHRVTFHGSKCRNLHGHRYRIEAWCSGPLVEVGEEQGMVMDFGFLKEEMMVQIDKRCDHGLILWQNDPLVSILADKGFAPRSYGLSEKLTAAAFHWDSCGKVYLVPFMPTAENLARHWFELLEPRIRLRSNGRASLHHVRVWETPNCSAQFPVASGNG